MSLRFEFGTKKLPIGHFKEEEWNRLKPIWKQIRTVNCVEVKKEAQPCGEVDALWTREEGLPIAVTTADCVPILLYRRDLKAIAVIHAGWEGTLQRIVPVFFRQLPAELQSGSDWVAKIGPSIRACCYEFGEDLLQKFYAEFSTLPSEVIAPTPRHLDLIAILKYELVHLGVEIESIDSRCTFHTLDEAGDRVFLSFRQGDRFSRQYSIIMK